MYSEFIIPVIFFASGVLGASDIIKRSVNKIKAVVNFVSLTETDPIMIAYRTGVIACQAVMVNFTNEDVKVGKNLYEVSYKLLGKKYKMLVKIKRGPCPINSIIDDDGNDITDKVLPYMGPKFDWHGQQPDPSFFDCETMNIEKFDGTSEIIGDKTD